MSIHKNEIPLLEYDSDMNAVIMPDHDSTDLVLPPKAVFAFLGETVDQYARENGADVVSHFISATKDYPVYVLDCRDERICLMQAPVGAPAATQILDWLIAQGVRKIISGGSCGVLRDCDENVFLVPRRALRDEGTSYHYQPPSRFIDTSEAARAAIEKALLAKGLKYTEVMTWSTDGFFRETKAKVEYRRDEGCDVVEMECAALAACAKLRGAVWGELLFTADTLADVERYDMRGWGFDSVEYALQLCVDAVLNL